MDDNEQKINNNVVANAASLWLKNTNEPVRAARVPVSISWQLHRREISATPVFDSHRRVTLRNHELFRIKCPFYNLTSSLSVSHVLLFLALPRAPYSAWLHHNGDQALGPGTTPSLPNPDKTKCIVTRPPKRGSYRAISCFRRWGRNATFPMFVMCVVTRVLYTIMIAAAVSHTVISKFSIIIDCIDNIRLTPICWRLKSSRVEHAYVYAIMLVNFNDDMYVNEVKTLTIVENCANLLFWGNYKVSTIWKNLELSGNLYLHGKVRKD